MSNLTEIEAKRFKARYVIEGDCHVWIGPLDRDGYGSFFLRGTGRRAHRVGWYSMFGEIPEGYVINHTCRNRGCVNPQHLQAITVLENVLRDSASLPYINSQKTVCAAGHPFDRTEIRGEHTYRVCSICDAARRRAASAKRRAAGKQALRV